MTSQRATAKMADAAHPLVAVVQVDDELVTDDMMGVTSETVTEVGRVSEDILQQALEEASGCFDNNTVQLQYVSEDGNCVRVADGSEVQMTEIRLTESESVGDVQDANGTTYAFVEDLACPGPGEQDQLLQVTVNSDDIPDQNQIQDQIQVQDELQSVHDHDHTSVDTHTVLSADDTVMPADEVKESQLCNVTANEGGNLQTIAPDQTVAIVTNGDSTDAAALGSSQNPIRIVQQGSQYTSVQQLTPDQLQQILQVVQEQQLAKATVKGSGSSVLFNPSTQTRIVYRVIYPSELHARGLAVGGAAAGQPRAPVRVCVPTESVMIQNVKRPYRKRKHEDEDKTDAPDLSKEEKEARKKHRPRTRSGRVSRPPKHMVQDYKHIHPVDWDEDYDDSDGGYSDYRQSDDDDDDELDKDGHSSSYTPLSKHLLTSHLTSCQCGVILYSV